MAPPPQVYINPSTASSPSSRLQASATPLARQPSRPSPLSQVSTPPLEVIRPDPSRKPSVCSISSTSSTSSSSSTASSKTIVDSYRTRYANYLASQWGISPAAVAAELDNQCHQKPGYSWPQTEQH